MNNDFYFILLGFVISLIVGRLSIPRIIIISKKKRLFDTPDARKVHSAQIPRLGGISFFPAIVISFCFTLGVYMSLHPVGFMNEISFQDMLFFFAGLMVIFITGLNDDLVGMNYKQKIVLQLLAALILVIPMYPINSFGGILGMYSIPPVLATILVTFFIVGMINAYNLIDGVDGLCSGLSSTAFIAFGILFWFSGNFLMFLLSACSVGVVLAFFAYNVFGSRLKIFMGDSGSLMLGFIISYFVLQYFTQEPAWNDYMRSRAMIVALGIVFVPIFDTARVFLTRMLKGKSPFYPDKNHIHHKLLRVGFTHLQSTGSIILLQVLIIVFNATMSGLININFILLADMVTMILLIGVLNHYGDKKVTSSAKASKVTVTKTKK